MDAIQPHQPGSFFRIEQRDLLAELLADKRSPNTRRAYQKDLADFFQSAAGHPPSPQLIGEFLGLERFTAIALVSQYKASLISRGLAEATINRRLAAIKSLVRFAQKQGKCAWSLEEVEGEKIKQYRDTSGVSQGDYLQILATCNRATSTGKRNYAILILLWSNVLRREEVAKLLVSDFNPDLKTLRILGKGRGTQAEQISLSQLVVAAISDWLQCRDDCQSSDPLFISLSNNSRGKKLSGNAIYDLVCESAIAAGLRKHLSPHRVRHSGITAALELTGGDVRKVQKLSRHARLDTLMLYDDARQNAQGEMSELLSRAINGNAEA